MSDEYDPWYEAKKWLEQCKTTTDLATKRQIAIVDHLHSEIDRLTKRVAELEAEPEFTPAFLKRADEIVLGDVVLKGGAIRTVTEIDLEPNIRIIRYHDLKGWYENDHLIAVLRQPLVEAKTLADMQPPFEGPTVGLGPMLEGQRDAQSCEKKRGTIETVQIVIGAILAIPLIILFAPFVLFPLAAWCVIRFAESVEPVVVRWFPGLKGRKRGGNEQ